MAGSPAASSCFDGGKPCPPTINEVRESLTDLGYDVADMQRAHAFGGSGGNHVAGIEAEQLAIVRQGLVGLAQILEAVHMIKRLAFLDRRRGRAFLGATAYWVGDIGCLWACLHAFHDAPDLAALVIGYATGYALTRRTLPLGGAEISMENLVRLYAALANHGELRPLRRVSSNPIVVHGQRLVSPEADRSASLRDSLRASHRIPPIRKPRPFGTSA